jgi:hypothetical protein
MSATQQAERLDLLTGDTLVSFQTDVNAKKVCWHLENDWESRTRIGNRNPVVQIKGSGSVSISHGSGTLPKINDTKNFFPLISGPVHRLSHVGSIRPWSPFNRSLKVFMTGKWGEMLTRQISKRACFCSELMSCL